MIKEISQQLPNALVENIRRACQSNILEPGVWYVMGKPTDALTFEQARAVQQGKREPVKWINLGK